MNIPIPIIATILGFVFSMLIFVIGILINVLSKNTEVIRKMEITIAKQETADGYEAKRHDGIDKIISEHSSKIEAHGIIIAEHELKLKSI